MREERAGDQAETTDEQHQHDEGVEEAGWAKVDVHVGDNTGEDEEGAREGQKPPGFAAAVPEEDTDPEKHGDERDAEVNDRDHRECRRRR